MLPVTGWEDHDARILASGTLVADVVTSAWPQGCLQVAIRRRPRAGRDVLLGAATAAACLVAPLLGSVCLVLLGADVARGWWRSGPLCRRVIEKAGAR